MMLSLWNLVLSGFPGSGKTVLAKKILADYPRFARVSGDDLRAMFFNEPYPCREESILYPALAELRDLLLRNNFNVIVDTTSPDNDSRKFLMETKISSVNSLLVVLVAEREVLVKRNDSVGHHGAVEIWEKDWQEPSPDLPMLKF
jgi:predicted kinase